MSFHKKLKTLIKQALIKIYSIEIPNENSINLEIPNNYNYGDLCTTAPLIFAKTLKQSPLKIAENLCNELKESLKDIAEVNFVAPGFINFKLKEKAFAEILLKFQDNNIIEKVPSEEKQQILIEYVSANPTGDLHLGHGRGAVLGSALVSIFKALGHNVLSEFYINDAGEQMLKLGRSASTIYFGKESSNEDEYPKELIEKYVVDLSAGLSEEEITIQVKEKILEKQKQILKACKVEFDSWISEKQEIHDSGILDQTLQELKNNDLVYEKDGATWLNAIKLGDQRDRVLIKSENQKATYLMGDLAYHKHKFARAEKLINLWGADHQGQDVSLKLGLKALNKNPENLTVLFLQLVSLFKDNEEVKMSKRSGTLITVEEVLEEVGADAFRTTMLNTHVNNRLIFDVNLVKKKDDSNPVFYLQYAFARASGILRRAFEDNFKGEKAFTSLTELEEFSKDINNLTFAFININENELIASKNLLLRLEFFNQELYNSAKNLNPCNLLNYLSEIAGLFHSFYAPCKAINPENKNLSLARLCLIQAFRNVMKNGLEILLISAPEIM